MSRPQHGPRSRPANQLSEELILAALERASLHRTGDLSAAPIWSVLEHLAIPRRSADARQLRASLATMRSAGLVETSRPHGVEAWELTAAGRRRLRRAHSAGSIPPLPESPQHRQWRTARAAGAQEIERFRAGLRELLADAETLLDDPQPASSDAWFELAEALRLAIRKLGSASYCLYEWSEPDDESADLDTRTEPGDERLEPAVRDRRRARRMGRRNVTLWRERPGR